ncbi:MAG: protein kinase [Cyanobacteria bacterium SZAS-4]|nr:protein kinase [Cyanobacteria bacterium SZAS-4]
MEQDLEQDLVSTRQQAESHGDIAWADDSSDGLPAVKDPFWAALTSISDRLQILGRIGKGGMSVVYKAMHLSMKKPVAVKLLLPHLTSDPKSLKRFQLEAQATANLNHPNIVRIYDCGMTEDQAFIIMDFIEGESLEQILDRETKLMPERALELFTQLCEGINHAHEHGIIHRDLKPSNVMITSDASGVESVKVVDFGIAKLLVDDDGGTKQSLTQTGDVFGSPLYMSPEQCAGEKIDKRSDIYSTGCLMYEVLAGRPPIVGKNFIDTMQKHASDLPRPFVNDVTGSKLAKRLEAIIFTCMAKEPSARYQDMKTIANDLKIAATTGGTEVGDWKDREKSLSQIIKKASKKTRVIRAVALSTVAVGLIVGGLVLQSAVAEITKPSDYQNKQLFELIAMPKATVFTNYEAQKQQLMIAVDRNEASDDRLREEGLETAVQMYTSYGKWKEALSEYDKLLQLPVGLEKMADYHAGMGICCLGLGDYAAAKSQFQQSITYYLKLQNGYQRGDEHPTTQSLLSGLYGVKARQPISYLALAEEKQGRLREAFAAARVLLVSGRHDDESERPAEEAYVADLNRRMQNYSDALILFQKLNASANVVPDRDYRTKLNFAIGLCLLATNDPARAALSLHEGLQAGGTDQEMLLAMDHEYHRALWESGEKLDAFLKPHTINLVAAK